MLRYKSALAAACCFLVLPAGAQSTNPADYNKLIAYRSSVATLTDTFAGDRIELGSGSLDIVQTDADLPGNNSLPVRVGRRFQPADGYSGGHFGDWTLEIPSVHGTFALDLNGWQTENDTSNRCSEYGPPQFVNYMGASWDPNEYWHGTFFYLPGSGDQELLKFSASRHVPGDGGNYHATTKEGAVARCVALATTSAANQSGEGFEIVTRDGVVYTLNQMVTRYRGALRKTIAEPASLAAAVTSATTSSSASANKGSGATQPLAPVGYNLPRYDYFLFPTKVADRFGNTVTYNWSTSNPWQLTSMVASDGRHLDFTYESSGSQRVTAVSDGTRTWQYAYSVTVGAGDTADTVTLPDGTQWIYRLTQLHSMSVSPSGATCDSVDGSTGRTTYTGSAGTASGSIVGPSGATLTLSLDRILLGRSHVTFNCVSYDSEPTNARPNNPYLFVTAAIVGKKITGPGLPAGGLNWSYSYGPTNNCWDGTYSQGVACTGTSPATRSVLVTDPDGVVTRYTFGNRSNVDEGLLYLTESGWNGAQAERMVQIEYADPGAAPYASYSGWSPRGYGDFELTSRIRPRSKTITTQQGRVFVWAVASDCSGAPYCFDSYGRPTKVVKSSASSP